MAKKVEVREHVFQKGTVPTGPENRYPRSSPQSGTAEREQFQREDGRWVVRYMYTEA